MNINFGMDNFYVRYLKRFLASEMPQTNMVLGEFDKDDLELLIQYLNLPNVEPMSRVQRELNSKFPQLKTMFYMTLKDNYIKWTARTISHEASDFIQQHVEEIKDYCETVGWELEDASEWVDDLKDINSDGYVDEEDRRIMHDLVYNNNGYEVPLGRISGKLVCPDIVNWTALEPDVILYNSYGQQIQKSNIEFTNHTYLFRDLENGYYSIKISAKGYLDITMNNIYVKKGYMSIVQDISLLPGDVDGSKMIDDTDIQDNKP